MTLCQKSLSVFSSPRADEAPFPDANFSSAPLESVTRVQVFSNETGHCRSLFAYEYGAHRAVSGWLSTRGRPRHGVLETSAPLFSHNQLFDRG